MLCHVVINELSNHCQQCVPYLSSKRLQANDHRIQVLAFPQVNSLEGLLGWYTEGLGALHELVDVFHALECHGRRLNFPDCSRFQGIGNSGKGGMFKIQPNINNTRKSLGIKCSRKIKSETELPLIRVVVTAIPQQMVTSLSHSLVDMCTKMPLGFYLTDVTLQLPRKLY